MTPALVSPWFDAHWLARLVADPMPRFDERNSFLEHVGLTEGRILGAIRSHRREWI